jgi:BirA family biotin operon repressor/biotin-[acetyl-CoA-carboxylase] ligase
MNDVVEKIWIDKEKIQTVRKKNIMGRSAFFFNSLNSTNKMAQDLAKDGEDEGTLVVSRIQEEGYGRMNRTWLSPEGGLWFSLILRPGFEPRNAPKITLMAGVAVAKALSLTFGLDARIKWPNDVLIRGKKVCGILTEMRTSVTEINYIVLGIGLNANFDVKELPKEFSPQSTTLKQELGEEIDLTQLLLNIVDELEQNYQLLVSQGSSKILNLWREYSDTLGKNVRITTNQDSFEGIAVDLDETGALLIESKENEIQRFFAGDCLHLIQKGGKE